MLAVTLTSEPASVQLYFERETRDEVPVERSRLRCAPADGRCARSAWWSRVNDPPHGHLITCYLMDDVRTLRDLCWKLNASKPVITRALDRLSEFDLVRRKADPLDRRSTLIRRTTVGAELLLNIKRILADTAKAAREGTLPP